MSKTMKKIGSIFAAATMVGATLTGAIAADLKDLPAPFVANGKADVTIVVGASAATADVLGSIDIASALQAASVTTETVTVAGSKSSTVSDGAKVETSGNALLLGESLASVVPGERFDDSDLPELLADGTVTEEDDNNDFDYTQELNLGTDIKVEFDADDTDMEDPLLYLDLDTASDVLWSYELEFTGGSNLDMTDLEDSETITMLGRTFTFDPNIDMTGEITLFGSDKTEYMTLNEPKTFTVDGKSYTVEVTGGNSDNDNVVVAVNGVSKTVEEGESVTVNGLEIFAKDVFVTNIPTLSAAATLFIGSEEIVLQAASSSTTTWNEVEVGGESVNGLESQVVSSTATGNDNVTSIKFRFKPSELAGDIAGFDEKNWLEAGEEMVDPLFGTFKVLFNGGNYALDDADKSMFKIVGGDDELTVEFVNEDDNTVSFTPLKLNGNNVSLEATVDGEGYNGAVQNNIADGAVFILDDSTTTPITTDVFEVTGFTTENDERVVRLKNLGTGKTESYGAGDKIVGSYTVAAGINSTHFNLSAASTTRLYLKGGESYLNLGGIASGSFTPQNITLTEADFDQASANASVIRFAVSKDSSDSELDVAVSVTSGTTDGDNDDGNDFSYTLSTYGTYIVAEIDENDYVTGYVPANEDGEVHYEVFFAPTEATVSASGSTVTTQKVNPIAVGTAVLDSSVSLASESKNLIVVGGPCANSVAAALLKSAADNCGAGFTPGKAVVQLFDTPMGKTAMLVAGYEATETQAASRAVALMDKRLSGKSVTLTVTNTNDFTISSSQ